MRIKLGDLRKLIEENLDQMKLGVAGRWAPAPDVGTQEDDMGTQGFLDRSPPTSFQPDDHAREFNQYRQDYAYDMSGEPIVDDTVPSLPIDGEDETDPDLQTVVSRRYAG